MYHGGMKLWIDDIRDAPDASWTIARSSTEALAIIRGWNDTHFQRIEVISFDHDLGGEDTSRKVMLWLCMSRRWPREIRVHTANPVGRDWLQGTAARYAPPKVLVAGRH